LSPVEYAGGKCSLRAYIAVYLEIHCNLSSSKVSSRKKSFLSNAEVLNPENNDNCGKYFTFPEFPPEISGMADNRKFHGIHLEFHIAWLITVKLLKVTKVFRPILNPLL